MEYRNQSSDARMASTGLTKANSVSFRHKKQYEWLMPYKNSCLMSLGGLDSGHSDKDLDGTGLNRH